MDPVASTNSEQNAAQEGRDSAPASAAEEERERLRVQVLALRADYDNLRKRMTSEIDAGRRRERESILRGVIEVVDTVDRALSACGAESNPWIDGLEGVRMQVLEVLRRSGAAPFDARAELFDPARHEALGSVVVTGRAEGSIVEVIEGGYCFEDGSILRQAKVIVAKAPPEPLS